MLALMVVCSHTVDVTYGQKFAIHRMWNNPYYCSLAIWIVPAFFALSGFLVAGSLERCKTIAGFLYLRVIRIFPALVVEITLSALILGAAMTNLPLAKYFHDPLFFRYFLNCLGDIHYFLPGVFTRNPLPSFVNKQLWTVPFELKCYIIVAALGLLGIAHRRGLFAAAVFALFAVDVIARSIHHDHYRHAIPGDGVVMCFLFGVLAYNFRDVIPSSRIIALLAFLAAAWLFLLPDGWFLAPLPVAYVVVFLGLTNPRRIAILESGDYSYGIYLYAFPIQQAVIATGLLPRNGWVQLAASIPLILLLAVCSWHLWEKHWLKLRRFRPSVDNWFSLTRPGAVVSHIYRLAVPTKI
jgi:peptidoglycan/LPS O-acetylase OafA/YrhL